MADNKYKVIPTAATELAQYEKYSAEDTNLIESFGVNSAFDSQKHVSELHIYTVGNTLLRSISSYTNYKIELGSGGNEEGSSTISVDPEKDAIAYGYRNGGVKLLYIFFNNLFSEAKLGPKLYIKEISNDRTELKLSSTGILNEDLKKYALAIKDRIEDTSFFSEFRLNLGNNELFIGINIDYSDEEEVVTVKLYEPLPISVGLKATLDVCEFVSDPIAYEIEAEFTPDAPTVPRLREANFNIDLEDNTSTPSQYFNYDELFSYSVDNSNYQVYSLFNEKGAELSIDHTNYEDFIHFSSAEERLINFKYKLDLLNNYSSSIQNTNSELGSSGVTSDKQYYENLIEGIVNNFDHYERFLYFESGSNSWPKANGKKPYVNLESSNSEAITWFTSQRTAANNYDVSNFNALTNTIPAFIREDNNNAQYTLFVQMIAQHFDNLWIYSKAVSDKYNADNRLNVGVSRDLVEEAIKSLGVKLYNSSNSLEDLFKYFVGEFTQDTGEGINENIQAGNIVTRTKEVIDTEEIQVPVEVTTGEFTGLVMKLGPKFQRAGYGAKGVFLYVLKEPSKGHPFARPEVDPGTITPKEFAELFQPGQTYNQGTALSNPNPNDTYYNAYQFMRIWNEFAFTPGFHPTNAQIISNPENITRFYTKDYFVTFKFPNDRTDPLTGEIVPAGSYGPYRYRYARGYNGIPGYNIPRTGGHSSTAQGRMEINTDGIQGFINDPYVVFNAWDADGNNLTKLLRAGMTRNLVDENDTYRQFANFDANLFEVEITISDEPTVETTTIIYETETVQTTKIITEKVVDPFDTLPKDLYQKSVYKRIYHNLPFLLKTKGTQRGLRALINCFGIPYNIMKIKTSGGRLNSERPFFGTEVQSSLESSNIRTDNTGTIISGSTLSQFTTIAKPEDTYNQDLHNIEVGFSPSDNLNALIVNTLGTTFNVDDYIGDPRDLTADSYNGLLAQVKTALADITEKYDVKDFVRLIKFFDNVVFKMIKDFVPARSTVDTGVIIKPHILDKSKAKSVAVSVTQPEYSGSISVGEYSGSDGGIYEGVATGSFDAFGNPLPSDIQGEYDVSYVKQVMTPEGLLYKGFAGLSETSEQQAKFNGELDQSQIKLTDGELNRENTLKQIKYPTFKYNIRFLRVTPEQICFLDNVSEEYLWLVDNKSFLQSGTNTGETLDLGELFNKQATIAKAYINNDPIREFNSYLRKDGNPTQIFDNRIHQKLTSNSQYITLNAAVKNSLTKDDGTPCLGTRKIEFIRCAIEPAKNTNVIKPDRDIDLRDYFKGIPGGLEEGPNTEFEILVDGTRVNNPEKHVFNATDYTDNSVITITCRDTKVAAFDDNTKTCEASTILTFSACTLEALGSTEIQDGPILHFNNPPANATSFYIKLFKENTKNKKERVEISTEGGTLNTNAGYKFEKLSIFNKVTEEYETSEWIKLTSNDIEEFPTQADQIIDRIFTTRPLGLRDDDVNLFKFKKFAAQSNTVDGCNAETNFIPVVTVKPELKTGTILFNKAIELPNKTSVEDAICRLYMKGVAVNMFVFKDGSVTTSFEKLQADEAILYTTDGENLANAKPTSAGPYIYQKYRNATRNGIDDDPEVGIITFNKYGKITDIDSCAPQ